MPAWDAGISFGAVIGYVEYAPAGNTAKNVASTTPTVLDGTNLTVSFVAPASGAVLAMLSGRVSTSTSGTASFWCFITHGTSTVVGWLMSVNDQANVIQCSPWQVITGLTPGATYQWDWGAASGNGAVTASLKCYGSATVDAVTQGGPAMMIIWAL